MKKIIFTYVLSLFIATNSLAQNFNATVNRNSVPEGETFVLTLDLQDVDTNSKPDINILSKDFTVLSVSNSYRTNIINNQVSKSRQWNMVLIPNRSGSIVIPSIELEGYQTQPITINVIPAGSEDKLVQNNTTNANAPKFKMIGKANNLTPYVQEQINYQVKIYDVGGLQGTAPYFAVDNNDWIVKSLGEPKVETKIINGQNLREITFDYALFPQKSGKQNIPPVKFNGYYLTKNTRTDPFARFFDEDDFFAGFGLNTVFANKNPVVLSTKPIAIDVKAAPTSAGWWLPAQDVKLSAEFDNPRPEFKTGEPISRTIYLKAVGVLDTNLPDINFNKVAGLKQYPEKPVREMTVANNQVVSLSKVANVYIPERAGEAILPSIDVKWFNTKTNSFEIATIPEYRVNVLQGNITEASSTNIPTITTTQKPETITSVSPSQSINIVEQIDNKLIIWMLLGAFVGGILLTLLLTKLFKLLSLHNKHKRLIISAAKDKDLRRLRDELINWGQKHFPSRNITNLQDVADIFNNQVFNKEVEKIRETLYAENEKDWNADEFLNIFCKLSKQTKKHKRTTDEPLPRLYK